MKTFLTIIHIAGYFTIIWFIYVAYTTSDSTIDRIREVWSGLRGSIYIPKFFFAKAILILIMIGAVLFGIYNVIEIIKDFQATNN